MQLIYVTLSSVYQYFKTKLSEFLGFPPYLFRKEECLHNTKRLNNPCGGLTLLAAKPIKLFTHSPAPLARWGKKIGITKARKILGQDKNILINEGKEEEKKNHRQNK